jgi:RimJ/RimL family protein N-acetyltransferase
MLLAAGMSSWDHVEVGHVLLRRILPCDAEGVFAVHGDARVYAFDLQETHCSVADSERFITPMIGHWEQHGFGYWSVLVPGSWWLDGITGCGSGDVGRMFAGLGGVQQHTVNGVLVLNVYFRLAPAVHGRGLAGVIVDAAVRMAPEVARGRDLVVRTRPANAAARRVAERAGFVDEGLEPGTTDMQLLRLSALR